MTILISIVIGFAVGCLVNFAITIKSGRARNFGICILGALIGGAVIPWALSVPNVWTAVLGSVIGIAIVLFVAFRFSLHRSGAA